MRRHVAILVVFASFFVAGCGEKSKSEIPDSHPPEVAEADPAELQRPKPADPAAPKPKSEVKPVAPPAKAPPFAVYPQPMVPQPEPKKVEPNQPKLNPNVPVKLPPPPPVEQKKPPEPKETVSGSIKEFEWPTEIYGRTLADYVNDLSDPDPAVRHLALVTIPGFGPHIVKQNKAATKEILVHMERTKELDPGVRAAAYETAGIIGFESDLDTKEAVRLLFTAADQGTFDGGPGRLHAVQTLGSFGPKASGAIPYLVGGPSRDRAYETRRAVANALGRIAFDEVQGPSSRAIDCLIKLLDDHSAPVRLEAAQSLVLLGPPYQPRQKGAVPLKDVKGLPPPLDTEGIAKYVGTMKKRLAPAKKPQNSREKPSPTGLIEPDMQVEIYIRLAIMRIDLKEMLNEEHLNRLGMYVAGEETGPKLQALAALAMMGDAAAKRLDDVVKVLSHEDPLVVNTAVSTLVAMGTSAKPAIPAIEKLKDREPMAKEPKERDEEKKYWSDLSNEAIKLIVEAGKKELAPAPVAVP